MASVNLDTADNLNITCKQGDTFELTLTLKDSSGTALPLATDDYKFLMQVKKRGSSSGNALGALSRLSVPVPTGGGGEADSDDAVISDGIANTDGIIIGSTEQGVKGSVNFVFSGKDDNGNVTISVPASEMRRVRSGSYVYDLQYIVGATQKTILEGSFRVNSDISKSI